MTSEMKAGCVGLARRDVVLAVCAGLVAMAGPLMAQGGAAAFVLEDRGAARHLAFDKDRLGGLPRTEYLTSTVWTDSVDLYTGVLLRDLLLAADIDPGAGPGEVVIQALDGYSATIGFEEITGIAPMVAYLRNGAEMPLRAQGPFWLLFPFDDDPAFQNETTYARSVWQISHLRVER